MNKQMFFGFIILLLSIALAIIMMTLEGWIGIGACDPGQTPSAGDSCLHVGLRTYTWQFNSGSDSGSITSLKDKKNDAGRWYDAGTILLATGVIGIFLFVVSLVLLCISHRRSIDHYRYVALAGLYTACGLLILGIVLYAYKLYAGYSFILMTVAGFFYFLGAGLVVVGGWQFSDGNPPPKQVPDEH